MKRFLKFCVVGGGGFVVDSAVYLGASLAAGPLASRFTSFTAAVVFTYVFNRWFTFENPRKASVVEFAKYYASMVLGGAVNIGIFYAAVTLSPLVAKFPVAGIALGSVAGLVVNFLTSRMLLSSKTRDE